MSQQIAKLNHLRMAPRKVRLIADILRGLPIEEAEARLLLQRRRAAGPLLKLLRSAVANAKNRNLPADRLYVSRITVDQGPMLKRTLPRAMGRATAIQKKTSHVTLVLEEAATAYPAKFNIIVPKKEKKTKGTGKKQIAKPTAPAKPPAERKEEKAKPKKEGFFRRFFRRKSI